MQDKTNTGELESVQFICADCGLPVCGTQPRSDVTRYLSAISRCQCNAAPTQSSTEQNEVDGAEQSESNTAEVIKIVNVNLTKEDATAILGSRYEVLSYLGRGGMGSVFKVKDLELGSIFAVKILNPGLAQQKESLKRFETEAKASMQLSNPHLAASYAYGFGSDHTPYLVMDYLEGKTLEQIIKDSGPLEQTRAVELFLQLCEGLAEAHSKGVIHRDIKPSNIMIVKRGDVELAKLFDFGIAKAMPELALDLTSDMTKAGDLIGSPHYMAPEQCQGNPFDQRADIHALGCVMYKTLTGLHPFEGKNVLDTVARIITAKAKGMEASGLDISASLNTVVLKCLEKDPEQRYNSASELHSDLLKVKEGKFVFHNSESTQTEDVPKPQDQAIRTKIMAACIIGLIFPLTSALVFLVASAILTPSRSNVPQATITGSTPASPYEDAERLDALSYQYFSSGDYERAIPLLEFGIKTYKANGSRKVGGGREDNYLAENLSHVGKCYLMLKRYSEAQTSYREALKIFQRWGNYPGGMMTEAVNDYASTLRGLGQKAEAEAMLSEYAANNNLKAIP